MIDELKLRDHMDWLTCRGKFLAEVKELRDKIKHDKSKKNLEEVKKINFEDVSNIYNQLRKKYESSLSFHLASDFYIGEMEVTRKGWWQTKGIELDRKESLKECLS